MHTRSDGTARHVHGTLVPFTPHQAYSGKDVALRPLDRCAEVKLRLHNGKEGQVLYGILLSNEQVFVGQWPYGQINIIFEAHYCDPASAALVLLTRSYRSYKPRSNGVLKDKNEAGTKANPTWQVSWPQTMSRRRIPSKAI